MTPWTLSPKEAAEQSGFSRDRIYELVKAGEVAVVRSAGTKKPRVRILAESLEAWIRRNSTPAQRRPRAALAARPAGADLELPTVRNPLFS